MQKSVRALRAEGLARGVVEGEALGKERGIRDAYVTLLEDQVKLKFFMPGDDYIWRLRQGDIEELRTWTRRILWSRSELDLFGGDDK